MTAAPDPPESPRNWAPEPDAERATISASKDDERSHLRDLESAASNANAADTATFSHWSEFDLADAPANAFEVLVSASADLTTVAEESGAYRYVSSACRLLFGWDAAELVGRHQREFIHPDDLPLVRAALENSAGSARTFVSTYRFRCADGSYRWTESKSRHVEANGTSVVVSSVRDIGDRQEAEVRVQHDAATDPLTGVANRAVLMDRLRHALDRQSRGRGLLAVMFLDLDRFKVINDSVGHRIGDAVLLDMADRLRRFLRVSDTLARFGGDEFVIVAEDVADERAAAELGDRIAKASHEPYRIGGEEFTCTVSIGIALTADSRTSPETLLQEADLALYRAKDRGRGRAEVFDEELRTRAVGRLGVERMLRRALVEDRLRVDYQPIIDLRDLQPVGAEALVRIVDPGHGLIGPDVFIDVAEETGLLTEIDEWVFTHSLVQAAVWRARWSDVSRCSMSVNVSARRLSEPGFAERVVQELDAHAIAHDNLLIEVTERVLMEVSNSAMSGLRELQAAGIQIGLDDFGTGYSSLAYLRQFPIDFVKIDKSFIRGVGCGDGEDAIVAAIVDLSHALDLRVVAEGVETTEQQAFLTDAGCDEAQGYLFARPDTPAAFDNLMRNASR